MRKGQREWILTTPHTERNTLGQINYVLRINGRLEQCVVDRVKYALYLGEVGTATCEAYWMPRRKLGLVHCNDLSEVFRLDMSYVILA